MKYLIAHRPANATGPGPLWAPGKPDRAASMRLLDAHGSPDLTSSAPAVSVVSAVWGAKPTLNHLVHGYIGHIFTQCAGAEFILRPFEIRNLLQ